MFHYYKTRHIFNAKLHKYIIFATYEITEQEYLEADGTIANDSFYSYHRIKEYTPQVDNLTFERAYTDVSGGNRALMARFVDEDGVGGLYAYMLIGKYSEVGNTYPYVLSAWRVVELLVTAMAAGVSKDDLYGAIQAVMDKSVNNKLVADFANTLSAEPLTLEEVDTALRQAGYDPDAVGEHFQAVADAAIIARQLGLSDV